MSLFTRVRLLPALLLAALVVPATPGTAEQRPEYSVKAAFLYHFVEFVEWPANAPLPATITIGVLGKDPFGDLLDRAILHKVVMGRPLAVRRFETVEELQPCQILFVSSSEMSRLPEAFARLDGAPVLTVGEADRFARRGGMIGFLFEEDRVRLEINLAAAEATGLRVSSKLLSVARLVKADSRQGN
jgi:uncharacterized protein DUF4154